MAASHGMLAALVTDFWNPFGNLSVAIARKSKWKGLQDLAGRNHTDLLSNKVFTHPALGIEAKIRRLRITTRQDLFLDYVREGRAFAEACARQMKNFSFDTYFGFSSASLEALEFARKVGKFGVIDQIDPARVEDEIVAEERRRFPALERDHSRIPESYLARLDAEWETAHRVIVNSSWCRSALIKQGVPPDKLKIVPLPFRAVISAKPRVWKQPMKVLWLGTLCLRKGIYYALEAARLLRAAPLEFTIAGDHSVDLGRIRVPSNVTILGRVPRIHAAELYKSHDLFILPTLSDGFAITLVEAMAYGLPVISTNRCGEVVQEGVSGHLIPAADAEKLAEALLSFVEDKAALPRMSVAALDRARDFSPENVWPHYRKALFE